MVEATDPRMQRLEAKLSNFKSREHFLFSEFKLRDPECKRNDRYDPLQVMQVLGHYFNEARREHNFSMDTNEQKCFWQSKRYYFLRSVLSLHLPFQSRISFAEWNLSFMDCDQRYGGILISEDMKEILLMLPTESLRYPVPGWIIPQGKRAIYHPAKCTCGNGACFNKSRESDFDAALRNIEKTVGFPRTPLENYGDKNRYVEVQPYLALIRLFVFIIPRRRSCMHIQPMDELMVRPYTWAPVPGTAVRQWFLMSECLTNRAGTFLAGSLLGQRSTKIFRHSWIALQEFLLHERALFTP